MLQRLPWYICWLIALGLCIHGCVTGACSWERVALCFAGMSAIALAVVLILNRARARRLAGCDAPGDFKAMAPSWRDWQGTNPVYHEELRRAARFVIPVGKRVLELGCGWGDLLAHLEPARGVGVDMEGAQIEQARKAHPEHEFVVADAACYEAQERFDFVVATDLINQVEDVQTLFERARAALDPAGQLFIAWHNSAWEGIITLAERLGLKTPCRNRHWISAVDVENMMELAGLELIHHDTRCLCPLDVPFFRTLLNRFLICFPILRHFGFADVAVARLASAARPDASVTVLIPCRNEAGNIANALKRLPRFGTEQEVLFVEGNSTDNTWEEVQKHVGAEGGRKVVAMQQPGKGKGDAVRAGFARATGDILMILDADLTVQPEELPRFYDALISGKADFVNGTRLVYPMDERAMRFCNLLANKGFSVLFSWLLAQPIRDTLCGTKVLWRKRYLDLAANRVYFGDFDPFGDFDLLFGAARLRLKIINLPVHYKERTYGTTNIRRFRDGLTLLRMFVLGVLRLKMY